MEINNSTYGYFPFTPISNIFIQKYMGEANPSFVVIYIYILQKYMNKEKIAIDDIARNINSIVQSDIVKSLDYWQKKGAIKYNILENIIEIQFFDKLDDGNEDLSNNKHIQQITEKKLPKSEETIKDEKKQLFLLAEKKLAKTLSNTEYTMLNSIYEEYNLPMEVIAMLITYCFVDMDKKSVRYMEKVAINWSENNIDTIEKAEKYLKSRNEVNIKIKNAFGMIDTNFIKEEEDYIKKWTSIQKMDINIITEACTRARLSTGKIGKSTFQYADAIIQKWANEGVMNLDDIKRLDENYERKKTTNISNINKTYNNDKKTTNINKFTNYKHKEIDYNLLKKLENISLQERG